QDFFRQRLGGGGGPGGFGGGPGGFGGPGGVGGGGGGRNGRQGGGGGGGRGSDGADSVNGRVSASADSRTNAVVVAGPPETLDIIATILKKLDEDPATTQTFFIYPLLNAQAVNLEAVLNSMFGGGVGGFRGGTTANRGITANRTGSTGTAFGGNRTGAAGGFGGGNAGRAGGGFGTGGFGGGGFG